LVYGREVLHHARDLPTLCAEMARVLNISGGASAPLALWGRARLPPSRVQGCDQRRRNTAHSCHQSMGLRG
jgi:hypothetical protein